MEATNNYLVDNDSRFYKCSIHYFNRFINMNNLKENKDFMHSYYIDAQGVVMARRIHCTFSDDFEILDEPNEETFSVITNILNQY